MNLRIFDDPKGKEKNLRIQTTCHVKWAKELLRVHGAQKALQIIRPLAADFHVGHKKMVEPNRMSRWYRAAYQWIVKQEKRRLEASAKRSATTPSPIKDPEVCA